MGEADWGKGQTGSTGNLQEHLPPTAIHIGEGLWRWHPGTYWNVLGLGPGSSGCGMLFQSFPTRRGQLRHLVTNQSRFLSPISRKVKVWATETCSWEKKSTTHTPTVNPRHHPFVCRQRSTGETQTITNKPLTHLDWKWGTQHREGSRAFFFLF